MVKSESTEAEVKGKLIWIDSKQQTTRGKVIKLRLNLWNKRPIFRIMNWILIWIMTYMINK